LYACLNIKPSIQKELGAATLALSPVFRAVQLLRSYDAVEIAVGPQLGGELLARDPQILPPPHQCNKSLYNIGSWNGETRNTLDVSSQKVIKFTTYLVHSQEY